MKRFFPLFLFLLPAVLYLGSLTIRPLFWPAEYRFAAMLLEHFPWADTLFWVRLPAAVAALAMAALLRIASGFCGHKEKMLPAFLYLLLPPVFWFGRAATPHLLFAFPFAFFALAECVLFRRRPGAAGSAVLVFAIASYWLGNSLWLPLLVLLPPAALWGGRALEKYAERGDFSVLHRITAITAAVLFALALLEITTPVLCRHFPRWRSWGEPAAAPGLLLPCIWLLLVKQEVRPMRKLFYCGAALAFLLLALPSLLPKQQLYRLAPGEVIRRIAQSLPDPDPELWEASSSRGLLQWEWKRPASPYAPGKKFPPGRSVLIASAAKEFTPPAGNTCVIYRFGNCRLCYYPAKRGAK